MRLNPECIRDILLTVEETGNFSSTIQYDTSDDYPRLSKYSEEEFLYHVNQCKESGYFLSCKISPDASHIVMIRDLSPKAHEFLANVRNDSIWGKVKDVSKKLGLDSIKSIAQIAASIASETIKARISEIF